METRKLVAIAIVAIVVAGACVYFVMNNDKKDDDQSSKGGWYSWNPETYLCASSNVAPSPYWTKTIGDLYTLAYDKAPDYTKYKISDVPAEFLSYDSLVSYDADGNLQIECKYRDSNKVWQSYTETFYKDRMPTGGLGSGSYFICVYYLLCQQAGVDPLKYDSNVIAKMWSMAYGGDTSLYQGLTTNYGISTSGFSGVELPNPSKISDNKDLYVRTVQNLVDDGKIPVWICSGSSPAWDNGGQWMMDLMHSYDAYNLTLSISTFEDCLAEIEALGYIFGLGDYTKDVIDQLRLQMYCLYMESAENVKSTGHTYTALGTYTNSDWTFASNSGMGVMFELLHFENVYKETNSGNWDGENVIKAQPEIIMFCMSDPTQVDWDQAMRVPAETI